MLNLEDGLVRCGRVVWGYNVGYIGDITPTTFSVYWLDGQETTHLRPDLEGDEDFTARLGGSQGREN